MSRLVAAAVFLSVIASSSASALELDCMIVYHNTKSQECLDVTFRQDTTVPDKEINPYTSLVGFFGELFRIDPAQKDRILARPVTRSLRAIEMFALYRAGLREEAERFSQTHDLMDKYRQLVAGRIETITDVHPDRVVAENDLLFGAYAASGNRKYLTAMLESGVGIDEAMLHDAYRIAVLRGKFGPRLAPSSRTSELMKNLCDKYKCGTNPIRMLRVTTIAMGLWAVQTLGREDVGAKAALGSFFETNLHMQRVLTQEQVALENYLEAVTNLALLKIGKLPDRRGVEGMQRAVDLYERLVLPSEAFQGMPRAKKII